MKKIITLLLVALISFAVFAGGSSEAASNSTSKSEVEIAIENAQNMTLEELEAAAKAEFEAAGVNYIAKGVASGFKGVLAGFQEKYPWFQYEPFSSSKDQALYTELQTAIGMNQYVADIAMMQDAASIKPFMLDTGYMLNYVPKSFDIAPEDADPLTAIYVNKNFVWNKTEVGIDYLKNVWQLTGVDGANLKGIKKLSFQNPATENINMSFMIMLTSDSVCQKLASAYESYFGTPYAGDDGYKNIGYKFLTEFIRNVTTWHSSDTTAIKSLPTVTDGQIVYGPLNKVKNYPEDHDYHSELAISGWNTNVEGFDAYFYKMWIMIPKTAKLPYTSCLLLEYFFTPEAFNNGWGTEGYYSINPAVPAVEGDHTWSEWQPTSIVEDVQYVNDHCTDVSMYVKGILPV